MTKLADHSLETTDSGTDFSGRHFACEVGILPTRLVPREGCVLTRGMIVIFKRCCRFCVSAISKDDNDDEDNNSKANNSLFASEISRKLRGVWAAGKAADNIRIGNIKRDGIQPYMTLTLSCCVNDSAHLYLFQSRHQSSPLRHSDLLFFLFFYQNKKILDHEEEKFQEFKNLRVDKCKVL